jgi:hypothetical protein
LNPLALEPVEVCHADHHQEPVDTPLAQFVLEEKKKNKQTEKEKEEN